jgi:hypothetical protein
MYGLESERWSRSDALPAYSQLDPQVPKPAFLKTIEKKLDELNPKLRELSLQIHGMSFVFRVLLSEHDLGLCRSSRAHVEGKVWKSVLNRSIVD